MTDTIPDGYYFRSRPGPTAPVDWMTRTDPDGKVRDHTKEGALKVRDARDAVRFLEARCDRVVDLGCGLGFILAAFDPHKVWWRAGTEPDGPSAQFARDLGLNVQAHPCLFYGSFNGALSWNVLEHVTPDPLEYLRDAAAVVDPGGWLVLQTPNFDCETARYWGERFRLLHDPTHVSLFGETGLRRALRDTGWIVREMRFDFIDSRFNTPENNARLCDVGEGMSPSAIGNLMTAYCQRATEHEAGVLRAIGVLERSIGC